MRSLTALLVGALLSLGCHAGRAETRPTPLSKEQIEKLAAEIVANTPEHVHFAPGTVFGWVLFEQRDGGPPELVEAVLARLRERYTVHRAKRDVPPERLMLDENGTLLGYKDGFSFAFSLKILGNDRIAVDYSDWEGNVASSSRTISYEWTGSEWNVTERGPLLIS